MKRFSSQFIITNSDQPLRRGVITTLDDGTVISVEDMNGSLKESHSVEFHNGIIIPGFVNCHCHLELSHLKGAISGGKGLGDFILEVRNSREASPEEIISSAQSAESELYYEGIVLCADICNSSSTFELKKTSRIRYLNLLEVFGINPERAVQRMEEIARVAENARKSGLEYYLTPHSVYAVSVTLFRLLKKETGTNRITSVHFMESEEEEQFLRDHSGPLMQSYESSGIMPAHPDMTEDHVNAILNEVTASGSLILVHNTFTDKKTIREINKRGNTSWCLCPGSNIFIENKIPPADLLFSEGCNIVIGTDSLASNNKISILIELKILQKNFPSVSLEELVRWATINGAMALGEERNYGKIEPGMKPGLLLLQDVDLINMKLLPESFITRLI
jgi:cytosine/adenosine deaminase-related metal-dependent hydrolase